MHVLRSSLRPHKWLLEVVRLHSRQAEAEEALRRRPSPQTLSPTHHLWCMLFCSDAMTSTSNIAFGNAYKSVQANNINGSVHIGTSSRDRPRTVKLSSRCGTLSRYVKQDLRTHSTVSRAPKMRPSTRSPSSTSPHVSLTRASTCYKRYTAGRMGKTSDASSG
jgi:hypothetical protein